MGITIRHDAPAFAAAFGSGMAAGQQRRRKYALDMLMQNQRLPSMRGGMGGSRAGGGGGRPGVWTDPLALPSFEITGDMSERDIEVGGRKARVVQNAAMEGRARKMRLGKPIPSEWTPTYTSGEELDRRDELADAERDRKWKVEDREADEKFKLGVETRRNVQSSFGNLPPIPKHAPPDVRDQLQEARKIMSDIAKPGGRLDINDPKVMEAWNEAWNEYNTLMEGIPKPSGSEEEAENILHMDTDGVLHDKPIPGKTRPWDRKSRKPVEFPEQAQSPEKRADWVKDQANKYMGQRDKYNSYDSEGQEITHDDPVYSQEQAWAQAEKDYNRMFGSGAAPSAEGGTSPPVGTGTVLRPDGETAAPEATPPGAVPPPEPGAPPTTSPPAPAAGAAGGPPVAPTASAPPIDPYEAATRKPPVAPTATPTAEGQPVPFDRTNLPDAYWPNPSDRKTVLEPDEKTGTWKKITDPKVVKRLNIKIFNEAYDKILPEGKTYKELTGAEKAQLRRIIEGRAEVMEW